MKILLINPNTSQSVSDLIEAEARRAAAPGTQVSVLTAPFGVAYIETRFESLIGAYATATLAAEHCDQHDAIVVAAFGDPGIDGLREVLDIPVVGLTEAALMSACLLGKRFSIVAISRRITAWYRECVQANGLLDRLASIRSLDGPLQDDAITAIGRLGDASTRPLLAKLQGSVPRELQPTVSAALCLQGVDCDARLAYLVETLAFATVNAGYQPLLRGAVHGLSVLAIAGREPALVALFDAGARAPESARAPIALGVGTVALRKPQVVMHVLQQRADVAPALTLLRDAFDMLSEDFEKENFALEIRKITHGKGVDSAIEVVGNAASFAGCIAATRPGGTISNVGYHGKGDVVPIPRIEWGVGMADKTIRTGLCPGGRERMERLLRLLQKKRVDPTPLTTHRFPFSDVERAFEMMRTKADGILKPLILF